MVGDEGHIKAKTVRDRLRRPRTRPELVNGEKASHGVREPALTEDLSSPIGGFRSNELQLKGSYSPLIVA